MPSQRGRKRTRALIPASTPEEPVSRPKTKQRNKAPEREDASIESVCIPAQIPIPRRRRSVSAASRWDTNNPQNWSVSKFQEEVEKLGIILPAALQLKKAQLLQLYVSNRASATSSEYSAGIDTSLPLVSVAQELNIPGLSVNSIAMQQDAVQLGGLPAELVDDGAVGPVRQHSAVPGS